jgi:putative FmdB family regulatory protein
MPIYRYECRSCGADFETLVRSSDTPSCPSCGSTELEQQLSLIASPAKGGNDTSADLPPCAGGSGTCATCPAAASHG